MTGDGENNDGGALRAALDDAFPAVQFAMAYGSGVFKQKNHDSSTSMIDLVFAVDDPLAWHTENLARNASHYSFLQYFGADAITRVQVRPRGGADMCWGSLMAADSAPTGKLWRWDLLQHAGTTGPDRELVTATDGSTPHQVPLASAAIGNRLIKYGVVSTDTLCRDLTDWSSLYLSGRMHKPVSILHATDRVHHASALNLSHALHYALLCLPEKFTDMDLFMKIAGISYLGDFRMTFGENPRKVRNIVEGNYDAFRAVYRRKLQNSSFVSPSIHDKSTLVANTTDADARLELLRSLPSNVVERLGPIERLAEQPQTKKRVQKAVSSIVHRYSRTQSIKGIVTAGGVKTVVYVAQKLQRTYFKRR
ncbi:hypothetical protein ATCC90586_006224 [Pythium insidiosum]|nr:hypothetical protein ATCC90586_006224 [Pythium insidiosum]